MRAGARGYLDKAATQSEIVSAITAVADGEVIFGPTIARRVVEFFAAAESPTSGMAGVYPELTVREREVLDLAAGGRSKSQIASSLVLSPKSLRTNVSNIFVKLHVADRADAIVRARDTGVWR
jgi:DNA-binding NarL/FixJ family response regulator